MHKGIWFLLIVLLVLPLAYAGHEEWYSTTTCYDDRRDAGLDIKPCQDTWSSLRAEHTTESESEGAQGGFDTPTEEVTTDFGEEAGRLANVKGEVWITKSNGDRVKAGPGVTLRSGEIIETKSGGSVSIILGDGSEVRLRQNSIYEPVDEESGVMSWGRLRALFRSRFTLLTPIAVTSVRGTEFVLEHSQDTDLTILHMIEGVVDFAGGDEEDYNVVKAGESAVVGSSGSTEISSLDESALIQAGESTVQEGGAPIESPQEGSQVTQSEGDEYFDASDGGSSSFMWIIGALVVIGTGVFFIKKRKKKSSK